MEQLQFCKKILHLPTFPQIKLTSYGYLGSYQAIAISTIISLLFFILTGNTTYIYLINGLTLPILFQRTGATITNYWECFTVLLLIRRITPFFAAIDVILLVCLWHPNIALGKIIVSNLSEWTKNK